MKTIWIVQALLAESNNYLRIDGVFKTRKKAKAFVLKEFKDRGEEIIFNEHPVFTLFSVDCGTDRFIINEHKVK
jgi:hypothetical protein